MKVYLDEVLITMLKHFRSDIYISDIWQYRFNNKPVALQNYRQLCLIIVENYTPFFCKGLNVI